MQAHSPFSLSSRPTLRMTPTLLYLSFAFTLLLITANASPPVEAIVHNHKPLRNVSLRCCTVESKFLVEWNSQKGKYEGFSIRMFNLLMNQTGFQCEQIIQFPRQVNFAQTDNGSHYNDFIDYFSTCTPDPTTGRCDIQCDIGVGGWWEADDRMGVSFLPPHGYDAFQVITHFDNMAQYSDTFVFNAFHWKVWAAIAGLVLLFILIRMFDKNFPSSQPPPQSPDATRDVFGRFRYFLLKNDVLYRLRKSVKSTVSKMISYNDHIGTDHSTRQWLLSIVIALCGLFLFLVYEASMTASLLQEEFESDFQTVEDFDKCRIKNADVCLRRGDAVATFWESLFERNQSCNWVDENRREPLLVDNYFDLYQKTSDKSCKYTLMDEASAAEADSKRYCKSIRKAGDPFLSRGISFVVPNNWKYFEELRKGQLMVTQAYSNESLAGYLDNTVVSHCSPSNAVINFRKLRMFFICAYATCALILLYMIVDPQRNFDEEKESNVSFIESDASSHA